mmetsp:Transcript_36712/g.88748  ORF Transcript_36712/g.88748 Transcript_36712/m.88748 type:complete len:2674 (+) Transcript_36712:708-8729(+)
MTMTSSQTDRASRIAAADRPRSTSSSSSASSNATVARRAVALSFAACLLSSSPTSSPSFFCYADDSTARDDTSSSFTRNILFDLFHSTKGLDWTNSQDWLQQNADVCDWHGVVCYTDASTSDRRKVGQVQELDLSSNRLVGTVPTEVFDLPYLEKLILEDNPDVDVDLSGLRKAQHLTELSLSKTRVSNIDNIGDALNLQVLRITNLKIRGRLPDSLFTLVDLTGLYANYNSFSGNIPTNIGRLNKLEALYLYDSDLTGQIPSDIGRLTLLQILTLTNNALTGSLPQELEEMSNLQVVAIQQTSSSQQKTSRGISGPVPSFRNHRQLTELHLENQAFGGSLDPDFLLNSPNGKEVEVNLSFNQLSGEVPASLADMRYLSLDLAGNQITSVSSRIYDVSFNSCNDIQDWMKGDVRRFGCNAFLCPPRTWAPEGRTTSNDSCQSCTEDSRIWGRTECDSSRPVDVLEREILRNFYENMNGRSWKVDDGWLDLGEDDACNFHGITCDGSGRVTGINLRNNGLSGSVPADIFKLPQLQSLNLASNSIDIDFRDVSVATSLRSLDLSSTGMSSLAGLSSLSSLPTFAFLSLASNDLQGEIPDALFSIQSLEEVVLSHNDFSGTLSSRIGDLTVLKRFACDGNKLTGQLPDAIGNLGATLEIFDAAENQFGGSLPTSFNSLSRLQKLSLQQKTASSGGIGGPLLSFANLAQLTTLKLDSNQLTGSLPADFLANSQGLGSSIEVGLSQNQLEGGVPSSWSRFDQLFVDLAGNRITDIPTSLCSKTSWMAGAVAQFQCDAILCPVGTYNHVGRVSDASSTCEECAVSTFLGSTSCGDQGGTADSESELSILLDLYSSAGGVGWSSKEGWDASTKYCDFYGVECDGVDRVVSINLRNNGMRGSVPTSIFKLPQLRELILSGNAVDFSFEGISQANNLVTLYLDNTSVRSVSGVGSAPNLQTINLADNQLEGEVPSEIFFLTTLKKLDLGYNAFNGQLHNVIGALTSLESLHLYHNQFTGRLPAGLGDLTNLQELNLAENAFTGSIPRELNDLTNLRFLSLQREGGILGTSDIGIDQGLNSLPGQGLTGALPSFEGLPYLSELYLGGNRLTGSIPFTFLDGVIDTSSLVKVDLTSNALTGTIPASLTQFDRMSFFAGGNRITGIADGLCDKSNWLGGDVGTSGCNAILCPAETFSSIGRQDSSVQCQACDIGTNGIMGSFACQTAGEAQEGSQQLILETLYKSMGGANWIDNTNWLSDESICDWFGIECVSDGNKSVASIKLSNNGLSGNFPTQVYSLPNLLELNLRGNDISFSFQGIANAVNLQSLNLEETGLTSAQGLGQASSLKLLRLDGNNLNTFPLGVLNLPALEVLSLSDNSFSPQEIPSNLQSKTTLTYFACGGCGFTGPVPSWIGSLVNLQYLKLSQNAFTGSLPVELETLTSLKHLDLAEQATLGRAISGELLSFANQTQLTELFLQHNNFQGTIPATFLQSVSRDGLATVDLRYNALTGGIPLSFSSFSQMNLYVASNNMEEPIPQAFCTKNWNDGDVARYGCNGIVCPIGTYNSYGRATGDVECFPCDDPNYSIYLGTTSCGTGVEHQALIFLYRSYGGANWKSDNNWLRTDDHCSWEGITCHQSGDYAGLVQRIELPDNNLAGSMMFALIWQLVGLEYIDLSKNQISLPFESIGNAINLDTVILTETLVSSLAGVGAGQSLRSLHLTSSALTGPIPEELYMLTGLEELYLSHNQLAGSISANIGDMKQLKDLYLFGNNLSGNLPSELGLLARAEHMSLGNNRLQGTVPRQITSLPLLEFLSLENEAGKSGDAFTPGSGLSGPLPALDGLPRIDELYLAHNSFTGTIPDHFLQGIFDKNDKITIDLSFNQIEGSIPNGLSDFQDLNLLLAGNSISDVPAEICDNLGWMSGEVANGCDAILCPPGTYNRDGRRVDAQSPCQPCTFPGEATAYGSTSCGPGDADSLDDRSILFNFYDATGGSGWATSTGWRSDSPFCSWFGVTCETGPNGDQVVSELSLPANNLKGIVPSVIFHLNGLKKLDIGQNDVFMSFLGIDAAESLAEIYIDETLVNSLAGIGMAPSLTTLHARKNPFGWQPIPDEVFDVQTLVDLNLSDSMISGSLSPLVSQLTRLQRLTLTDNALSGALPSELGQLASLEDLELSNNNWIGTIPSSWSGMVSLQTLFIDNAKIESAGITGALPDFSTMPNLKELHLAQNQLTGTIPSNFISGISDTSNVVTIRLEDNHLIGTVPSSLTAFRRLNINLVGNLFTALGDGLCNQPNWNDGAVGRYSCDAILCPAGEFSPSGRQTSADDACQPCPGAESSPYFGVTSCVALVKAREREVLGALFEATNGNGWRNNNGWLDDNRDVCTWFGVSCQEDSTIESIRLGSNNLAGSIPADIYELPHLKSLWLYSNPVDLSFEGIGKSSSLRSLLVDSTKLRSLAGLGAGETLVEIDVGFNQLSGPIPIAELEKLSSLQSFSATNNALTGAVPEFTSLRRLNTLRLSDNRLNGDLPAFSRHPELASLDLSNNDIAGAMPSDFLAGVTAGQSLFVDLSNNFISGTVPGNMSRFNDVTIYLRDNRISGIDPSLCSREEWNEGDVGTNSCDGILCPAGTFSPTGRASPNTSSCEPCGLNQYYGGSRCGGSGASSYLSGPGIMTVLLISGTTLLSCLLQ